MKTLVLVRKKRLPDRILGWEILFDEDEITPLFKWATLELPWRNNQSGDPTTASCIPVSRYRCTFEMQGRRGFVMRVHDVPGRAGVLQHRVATPKDTIGCIGMGLNHTALAGNLTDTAEAQRKFKALLENENEVTLVVLEAT